MPSTNHTLQSLCLFAIILLGSFLIVHLADSEDDPVRSTVSEATEVDSPSTPWWEDYSRDKDRDGISDLLTWKLGQGDRFYPSGEARVFIRFDHHPTDADIIALNRVGVDVTYRAEYLDLLGTTMDRKLIWEIAEWPGVVMLDDIPKAVPTMHEAVPLHEIDQVWETYGIDGEGITIAVVDTGVDGSHVGLDDLDDDPLTDDLKIIGYYDAIEDQEYPPETSRDSGTHGTHVAGIAAGTGAGDTAPDGTPYIGVAPGANLINVLSCCDGDVEDIIRGIEWTISNMERFNIRIMTSSLGEQQVEYHIDNDGRSAWSQAVNAAVEAGIITTLSAGNEFGAVSGAGCNTIDSPGDAELPITVGSLDKDLGLALYSSRGYTSDGRVKPDVATIGSNIMAPATGTGTGYTSKSGTSMATPLMAGIAALTLEANPGLTPAEFKETIVAGYALEREVIDEDDITNDCSLIETRPDNEYGYGQAVPLVFVEMAGKIDPDLSVGWDLEPEVRTVNGTTVYVKPEVYNMEILTGTADSGGKPIGPGGGVQVRFGPTDWVLATDTSDAGDWSTWTFQVTDDAPKGNQTLTARLVVDEETMSVVDTVSVLLLDETAPEKDDDTPFPGIAWLILGAVAVARRRYPRSVRSS
jgi:serine protease AprX